MTLICIDPGHAESTAGKRSPDGTFREYEFNRAIARRLSYHLQRHGMKTIYSCDIEQTRDAALASRCNAANRAQADLFISLHANAYGTDWNCSGGWEIYFSAGSKQGKLLAQAIHLQSRFAGIIDRGVKEGTWYVIRNTSMPAVLIEHEFMTNKDAIEKLMSAEWREKWAVADARGILDYLKIPWKDESGAEAELTMDEAIAIVKLKAGLDEKTIDYLAYDYKYGKELIIKLAKMIIAGGAQ